MLPFGTPFGTASTQSNLANQYTTMTAKTDSWLPSWLPNPTTWLNPFAPGRATAQQAQQYVDRTIDQTKKDAADATKPYLLAGVVIAAIVGASFVYKNVRRNPRSGRRARRSR